MGGCSSCSGCSTEPNFNPTKKAEKLDKVQETNLKLLLDQLKPLDHSTHWLPSFTSKTEAIQAFLDGLGIGMLVMIDYKLGFMEKLLREPVITKMMFNISIPFLVIPESD